MLQFGNFSPGERLLDIGAGDGRILLEAIRQGASTATGYELNEEVYRLGLSHVQSELGHDSNAFSRCQLLNQNVLDMNFETILKSYDLITMFLLPKGLAKIMSCIENSYISSSQHSKSTIDINRESVRIVTQGWPLPIESNNHNPYITLHDTTVLPGGTQLYLYYIRPC